MGLIWLEEALNKNDRLEVVGLGDDGALWRAWQIGEAPNWSKWKSLGAPPGGIEQEARITMGTNVDRRLEVFVIGHGALWRIGRVFSLTRPCLCWR